MQQTEMTRTGVLAKNTSNFNDLSDGIEVRGLYHGDFLPSK
jgi:hypothetical protein